MPAQQSDDPWQVPQTAAIPARPTTTSEAAPEDGQAGLWLAEIANVTPLDKQLGANPRKTVPDALVPVLFGQPPEDKSLPEMQTYAILDAAKVDNLLDQLGGSGLQHRCLFKGQALEDLQGVAPWVVRLEPGSNLTRNLMTRGTAHWHLWDTGAGIFIRSRASIDEVVAHLRHFTRLQDEDGAWYYFRFWEPAIAAIYFPDLAGRPQVARRWFHPRRGADIAAMIVICPDPDQDRVMLIRPRDLADLPDLAGNALLTRREVDLFAASRKQADIRDLADNLRRTFGDDIELTDAALRDFTGKALDRLIGLGFLQRDNIFVLLSWELFFGPDFETFDRDGQLADILNSDRDEAERFDMLKQRMQALG